MKYQDLHKSGLDYNKIKSGFCPGTFDYTLVEFDDKFSNIAIIDTDNEDINFGYLHRGEVNAQSSS